MDPQSPGYDPKPLVQYLAALGVPYFFEEQGMSSYKPCKQSQCFHRLFFPIRTFVNSFCIKIKKTVADKQLFYILVFCTLKSLKI